MRSFLPLLVVCLIFLIGFLALGSGVGYLIHRISPSVDLGIGILIGMVACGFSIHYFGRFLAFSDQVAEGPPEADDDLPPMVWYETIRPARPGRKRKRK